MHGNRDHLSYYRHPILHSGNAAVWAPLSSEQGRFLVRVLALGMIDRALDAPGGTFALAQLAFDKKVTRCCA